MTRTNDSEQIPTKQELKDLAARLVAEQTTMTLATAADDKAWAAPVYYVFVKSAFYFLSSPNSRHIIEALQSGQASAAIYANASTWTEIKGLQMSGCIQAADRKFDAIKIMREYLKKYPFTKDFFKENVSIDIKLLSERFGVKLYKFTPTLVYYLDNQIQFAFRAEVQLSV